MEGLNTKRCLSPGSLGHVDTSSVLLAQGDGLDGAEIGANILTTVIHTRSLGTSLWTYLLVKHLRTGRLQGAHGSFVFELVVFLGLAVPAATPQSVKESLNKLINEATADEAVKAKLESLSFFSRPMNLQDCVELGKSERAKWQGYVATAKITAQ